LMTQEQLLMKLFEEVEYVWPRLGYPPLVTPFSQYVKNVSLMNAVQLIKGKKRWSMIDENTWGMLMGRSGKLPAPMAPEIKALAIEQNREFFTGVPQDLYQDELELFAEKMDQKGWDYGEDDEELLEYAMHPAQYLDYRSGKAKETFNADLAKRKAEKAAKSNAGSAPIVVPTTGTSGTAPLQPKSLNVNVNGEQFKVRISYDEADVAAANTGAASPATNDAPPPAYPATNGSGEPSKEIIAPLEGKFYLTKDPSETPVKVGDSITEGDTIAYIEAMKVINAITADKSGTVVEILGRHGEEIDEDDVIFRVV